MDNITKTETEFDNAPINIYKIYLKNKEDLSDKSSISNLSSY